MMEGRLDGVLIYVSSRAMWCLYGIVPGKKSVDKSQWPSRRMNISSSKKLLDEKNNVNKANLKRSLGYAKYKKRAISI